MPFVHISDEPLATTTAPGDLYVFDRPGTPYVTYKVAASSMATYFASTLLPVYVPYTGAVSTVDLNAQTLVNVSQFAVGGAATANTAATITATQANGLLVHGTLATASTNMVGIWGSNSFTPTAGVQCFQLVLQPTITSPSGGLAAAIGAYTGITLNGAGVIANAYGARIDQFSLTGATITSAYGIYVLNPGVGSSKTAAYVDDMCIGYSATSPAAGGFLASGQCSIGTASAHSGTVLRITGTATNPEALRLDGTYNITSSVTDVFQLAGSITATANVSNVFAASVFQTISVTTGNTITRAKALQIAGASGGGGTISEYASVSVDSLQPGTGTTTNYYGYYYSAAGSTNNVTNAYAAYFNMPTPNTPTSVFGMRITGSAIAPSTGSCIGFYLDPTFSCSSGTQSEVSSALIIPTVSTSNAIAAVYGLQIRAGSGSGSVSNAYGLAVKAPTFASANTAAYFDNFSVGYTGITPPTSGAVISGAVGIGTSSVFPGALLNLTAASTTSQVIRILGTQNSVDGNSNMIGIGVFQTMTPTNGSALSTGGHFNLTFIAPSTKTITTASGIYVYNSINSNVGTINTALGIYIDAGSAAGGTVSNHYGLYASRPAGGTNRYTAYFDPVVGIGTTPSSDRILYIGGNITQTASNYGLVVAAQMGTPSGTVSACAGIDIYPNYSSNVGTITSAYGMLIEGGATGGTITTGYSLYVANPTYGTTKICAFFEGPIHIGVNATGSGSAGLGSSNCPAATLSAPYNWLKFLSPDGSVVWVPGWK